MTALLYALALASSALLAVYGVNLVYLSLRALRLRPAPAPVVVHREPPVSVHVPVYNERYVARRVIDAVCALDWPRDRFQVVVLDDSDDGTVAEVAAAVERWQAAGVDIAHERRATRAGYKAGALAHGMALTDAPFIAYFDADFVPAPDFLRRVMAPFADTRVGWVQARWGHLNEGYSAFTRLQALMIDFHFLVEQAVRPALGYPTNFTGTAGVWRRAAIEAAGGWSGRTLAEDLDLSYRAQLAGFRGVLLEDVVAPQELPVAAAAYRGQQLRWATGTFQAAGLLLPSLLRSRLPWTARYQGAIRLLAYFAPLLMLVQVALYPLLLLQPAPPPVAPLALAANLLSLAPAAGLAVGQFRRGRGWWRPLPGVLAWSLVGAGTSLAVAVALFRALRPARFNRTPKHRIEGRGQDWLDHDYVAAGDPFAPAELALALVLAAAAAAEVVSGRWVLALYSGLFAAGFALLGGTSLVQTIQVLTLRRLGRRALDGLRRVARTGLVLGPAGMLLLTVAGLGVAFEDSYAHWLVAATLASGGGLRDPLFGMEDTWLPAYHVAGAGVLMVFGLHSLWALRALSIGLGLVVLALAARLAGGDRPARLAAALLVLNPAFLLTFTSATAEPLTTAALTGAAAALTARRPRLAAGLAALACLTSTKAWIWVGAAAAAQIGAAALRRDGRRPAVAWVIPALAVLALLQLGFAPAGHSIARASVEVASATQRGSLPAGAVGRLDAFAGWFALASLPLVVLAPLGILRELRQRPVALVTLHAPSLLYLVAVTGLVTLGLYSGSDRYYVLALPSLAVLAARGAESLPALATVGATAAAALLVAGYAPIFATFATENDGLLAAGRMAGAVPGGLLTDSPAAAYASGKLPGDIAGSRALPASGDAATGWLRAHGVRALVLEDVDYYRAATVFADLVAGEPRAPFVALGTRHQFDVEGGKPVTAWTLPPAGSHALVPGVGWVCFDDEAGEGKTAGLRKGATLEPASGADAAGEGMGFGAPAVHFADGWVYPGTGVTVDLGGAWRETFELDRLEVDDAAGRFLRFEPIPSRGQVVVDYALAGARLRVAARAAGLSGFDRLVLLNEESSSFDDLADASGTRRGAAIGPDRPQSGSWARLRSASLGVEFALDRVPGARMAAGRERDPARGLDWAGISYEFGPGFTSSSYDVVFRSAR